MRYAAERVQQPAAVEAGSALGSGPPALHPDLVKRPALMDWFSAHHAQSVVAIFAPAGYGKTTLVAQAAEADTRPFVWVSLGRRDNDPVELVARLVEALGRLSGVDPWVSAALRRAATSSERPGC